MLKIYILENQSMIREYLSSYLQNTFQDFFEIHTFSNISTLEIDIDGFKPNMIIMDIKYFPCDHTNTLPVYTFSTIKKYKKIKIPILIYSGFPNPNYLQKCEDLGVDGIVLRQAPYNFLINCIEAILKGQKYFCDLTVGIMSDKMPKDIIKEPILTKRQIEVYKLKMKGLQDCEISKLLNIEICSIRKHRKNARERNACNNDEIIQMINLWSL